MIEAKKILDQKSLEIGVNSLAIAQCAWRLTKGNTRLDPKLPAKRLVSRWRLWVSESWLTEEV